jgi:hypothetical protein
LQKIQAFEKQLIIAMDNSDLEGAIRIRQGKGQ